MVIFSSEAWVWNIGLAKTDGRARFSAGWNRFVREFEAEVNDILVFKMVEEEYDIVFQISLAAVK